MSRKAIVFAFGGFMLLGVVAWNMIASGEKEQRQEVYLGHGYSVGGVTLKEGKYMVVHKPTSEEQGKECTFFYKMPYRADKEPVVKMRCEPGSGPAAKEFTLKSVSQPDGTSVVKSIQFPGDTEIHQFGTGS